jgi:hypothetical protein
MKRSSCPVRSKAKVVELGLWVAARRGDAVRPGAEFVKIELPQGDLFRGWTAS